MKKIELEVIAVCKGGRFPKGEDIFHFSIEESNNRKKDLNILLNKIQAHFNFCDSVIVLENGKVIEVF